MLGFVSLVSLFQVDEIDQCDMNLIITKKLGFSTDYYFLIKMSFHLNQSKQYKDDVPLWGRQKILSCIIASPILAKA